MLIKRDVIKLGNIPYVVIEANAFGARIVAIKKSKVDFIDKYGKKHSFSAKGKTSTISSNSDVEKIGRMKKDKFKQFMKRRD